MTPDLKRALKASWASDEPSLSWDEANAELQASYAISTAAALRALRDPSPEVLEAMAKAAYTAAYLGNGPHQSWDTIVKHDQPEVWRASALAAWRAGLDAILAQQP